MANVMTFIRWKRLPGRKKSNGGGGSSQSGGDGKQQRGGRDGGGATAGSSPVPGRGGKAASLLPKQLPQFAGRKQVLLYAYAC